MSAERPVFVAHALCPPHLRKQVEDVAESFNPNWLLPPVDGEVFGSFQECFADSPREPYTTTVNDISSLGQQIMEVREGFTGLARARFEEQLVKTNRALLGFAGRLWTRTCFLHGYLIRSRSLNGQSLLKPMAKPLHGR